MKRLLMFTSILVLIIASSTSATSPEYGVLDRCHWTETPDVCTSRMQALGREGVAVVFNVRSSEDPLSEQRSFARAAQDAGLKVMWSLSNPTIYDAWATGTLSQVPYMTHFARDCGTCDNEHLLADTIAFWRSIPNTYGYYVADDTALNPVTDPAMRSLSDRIQALDPEHPTHVATFSTYDRGGVQAAKYQPYADRVMAELYPWHIPGLRADVSLSSMGARAADTQRAADAAGRQSAFWLQSFTWADNDASANAIGAPCPSDQSAEACYARGHWPTAAELTALRNQVLLNARPALIMWYYLDDVIGFVPGQRPNGDRWWGPSPEQAQQRWDAFTHMLHAPLPGSRGRIVGRRTHQRVTLRATGVQALGGARVTWRVDQRRRFGSHVRLHLRPGRHRVRLYVTNGWGESRMVDTKHLRVYDRSSMRNSTKGTA